MLNNNQMNTGIGMNTRNTVLRERQRNRPMNKKSKKNLIIAVSIGTLIAVIAVLVIFGYIRLKSTSSSVSGNEQPNTSESSTHKQPKAPSTKNQTNTSSTNNQPNTSNPKENKHRPSTSSTNDQSNTSNSEENKHQSNTSSTNDQPNTSNPEENKHEPNTPISKSNQGTPVNNNQQNNSQFKNDNISLSKNNIALVAFISQGLETNSCFSISSMLDYLYAVYPNLSTSDKTNIKEKLPSIDESMKSIEKSSKNYIPSNVFNIKNNLFLLEQADDETYIDIIKDKYKFIVEDVSSLNTEEKINNINSSLSQNSYKIEEDDIRGNNKIWTFESEPSFEWMYEMTGEKMNDKRFFGNVETKINYLTGNYNNERGINSNFLGLIDNEYYMFEAKIKSEDPDKLSMFFIMPNERDGTNFSDMLTDIGDENSRLHKAIGTIDKDSYFRIEYNDFRDCRVAIPYLRMSHTHIISILEFFLKNETSSGTDPLVEEKLDVSENILTTFNFGINQFGTDDNDDEKCGHNGFIHKC